MINGIYHNPTTIFFGKGMETRVGEEVAKYSKKALLHFGGDSFKKYGLYDKVVDSLRCSKVEFVELGGVKPNPRASLVYKGIDLCRKEHIDFVLAVGGGSVIDSAKAISVGVPWQGDFFDFFYGKQIAQEALRVATILTIPGSGSESSAVSVITHEKKGLKLTCYNTLLNPVFSILNPELTFSLDAHRTSSGIADAVSHILERYFTNTTYVDCTDRICEGLFKNTFEICGLSQRQASRLRCQSRNYVGL
jgi:alcohol dehydrogenase YqhD (iron-dependent ADH family)